MIVIVTVSLNTIKTDIVRQITRVFFYYKTENLTIKQKIIINQSLVQCFN